MAFITRSRQATQIHSSDLYDDTIAPSEANFETNPTVIEEDLNNVRSSLSHLKDVQTGDWFDVLATPSTFENGAQRGVDNVNQDLHDLERKRILDDVFNVGVDLTPGAGVQVLILGAGELPGNTTLAIGLVNTLGTVVQTAGAFGTASLDEVVGPNALRPLNRIFLIDQATGEQPVGAVSGETVYGLLQSESAVDGSTATDTTPNRLQISFVIRNGTSDDLILATSGDVDGMTLDYSHVEQFAFEDIPKHAFLGGSFVDAGAASTTRQAVYDNQGIVPVDVTTNSILHLEGPSLFWEIGDDLEATLLRVTEGSAGGTSVVNVAAAVDTFDVDAIVNDFSAGATLNSGGTRPIAVGVTDGVVASTAGDLRVLGAGELFLDDGNQTGSTWAQTDGIKLSETTAEWDAFEVAFGEVSLLSAITSASTASNRTKIQAVVTANTAADTDVSLSDANLDVTLGDLSNGDFVTTKDFYLNGKLLRNGANAAADQDVYPGTSLAIGQVRFEDSVQGTGNADVITVINYAP